MAPKRSTTQVSDDEASSPAKKSRTSPATSPSTPNTTNSSSNDNDNNNDNNNNKPPKLNELIRSPINVAGKPAECGIIRKIYVENFMCHKKLKIELCNNVNFIYGQNGSGKSAILAALQICLGAGANRTHRARNLKDLVRKEGGATHAKVRVTLLNRGPDAFQHDVYGDLIHIERNIFLRGSGGGYKLYAEDGKTCKSEKKRDLQLLLDQMNIQCDNPVAVLDQEEAKKFLTGKSEDKYAFFLKATDLERMDRKYVETVEHINTLNLQVKNMGHQIAPLEENVKKLHQEWQEFQNLEKLENKKSTCRVQCAWSIYALSKKELDAKIADLDTIKSKVAGYEKKLETELAKQVDTEQENEITKKLQDLTSEAEEAKRHHMELLQELKEAMQPKKRQEQALRNIKGQVKRSKQVLKEAAAELQKKREDIMERQGTAGAKEAERARRTTEAEMKKEEAKKTIEESKRFAREFLDKYEGSKSKVTTLETQVAGAKGQKRGVDEQIRTLKRDSGDSSLRVYGEKCEAMYEKVMQAQRQGKFRGKVIGPIGKYLKVASGKDQYAEVAESALGVGLDRFIVTNQQDRGLFLKMRQEINCRPRDCGVYQMSEGPRYRIRQPPEGVETVATIFTTTDDLVYNCLVDNGQIDTKAVCDSMQGSWDILEIKDGNRSSIKGGHIRTVYSLPLGDHWQVLGGFKAITSHAGKLRKRIGIDTTEAIRQAESERAELQSEIDSKSRKLADLKRDSHEYKVEWNKYTKADKAAQIKIQELSDELERIREEADEAENISVDTSEFEDEVKKAEEDYEKMKANETEMEKAIEDMLPGIHAIQNQLDEVTTRNEKVKKELLETEESLNEIARARAGRERLLQKKKEKLEESKLIMAENVQVVQHKQSECDNTLRKARLFHLNEEASTKKAEERRQRAQGEREADENPDGPGLEQEIVFTEEEIAAVEPVSNTKHPPEYYHNKMRRIDNEIARERARRNLTETDPEVALEKYTRAKRALDTKMYQIDKVENNMQALIKDLKERKKLWKTFRDHIVEATNHTFDEVLNRKGSSGTVGFNHKEKTLDLIVQKDNQDENSQTADVKALSGGERSYTTLALLLALGESLETPFRVMDEFDVFLDHIARKIALNTMIEVAKTFEHRQFIFITPQDITSIKTDSKLKILQMKPPERNVLVGGAVQQTL